MSDGGKGSKPRPFSVSQEEYENRWNAIFQREDVVSKSQAVRLNPSNRFRKKNQMLLKTFDNPKAFEIAIKENPLVTSNA